MKRTFLIVAVLALTGGSGATLAAAPPGPPQLAINPPEVTCGSNNLVATVSVTTEATLQGLLITVERWETINTSYWPDQRAIVEIWQVNLSSGGRKAASLPSEHTIDTDDDSTWMAHSWADPTKYTDNSGVFLIQVHAEAQGSRGQGGASAWTTWMVDCELNNTTTPYNPWEEMGWQDERGTM